MEAELEGVPRHIMRREVLPTTSLYTTADADELNSVIVDRQEPAMPSTSSTVIRCLI